MLKRSEKKKRKCSLRTHIVASGVAGGEVGDVIGGTDGVVVDVVTEALLVARRVEGGRPRGVDVQLGEPAIDRNNDYMKQIFFRFFF